MANDTNVKLLERVRDAVLKPELFDSLRDYRQEIAELLDEHELDLSPEQEEFLDKHPEGVEQLYAFLAEESPATAAESEALRAALAVRDAEDESIGRSFQRGLCKELGPLADPSGYFKSARVKPAPQELVDALMSEPSVEAAWPAAEPLVRYGLTPVSVYRTCDAARSLADRLELPDPVVIVPNDSAADGPGEVRVRDLATEAASLDDGEPARYEALLNWLIDIVRMDNWTRQFMFRGFNTVVENDRLRLNRVGGNQVEGINVEEQWEPIEPEDMVPASAAPQRGRRVPALLIR